MTDIETVRADARAELKELMDLAHQVSRSLLAKHEQFCRETLDFGWCRDLAESAWRAAKHAIATLDN